MRTMLLYVSGVFAIAGLLISVIGLLQVNLGIPATAVGRTLVQLQSDSNQVLLGIGFLVAGLALVALSCAVSLIGLVLMKPDVD
jgi:hypothetical protein